MGPAVARIPADIEARILEVAADYQARAQRRAAMAPTAANPILAGVLAENDRRVAESRLASVVIATITARPTLAGELMQRVAAVAPDLDAGVRRQVARAFPFRAPTATAAPRAAAAPQRAPPRAAAPRAAPIAPPRDRPRASTPRPGATFGSVESAELDADEEAAAAAAAADEFGPRNDDPIEGFNRGVFWVNDTLDQWILRPVAWGYGKVMPEPAKRGLRNVVQNLKGPVILVNDMLQLEFADASVTAARFLANTLLGVGGLFDVADSMGLERHPADFGQTLYSYNIESGPYLVLPLLGPSTVRDGVGRVVDNFFDPLTYILEPSESLIKAGAKLVIDRERVLDQTDELRKSSLDYYAAVRSLYLQDRAIELKRDEPEASARARPWVTTAPSSPGPDG